ncbi:hypothetical protein B0H11DRAFT_2291433 [Mycena galericulata]|nr:hypothetical protein B0H11DRAFT_2291433 [Mycena galericulata]
MDFLLILFASILLWHILRLYSPSDLPDGYYVPSVDTIPSTVAYVGHLSNVAFHAILVQVTKSYDVLLRTIHHSLSIFQAVPVFYPKDPAFCLWIYFVYCVATFTCAITPPLDRYPHIFVAPVVISLFRVARLDDLPELRAIAVAILHLPSATWRNVLTRVFSAFWWFLESISPTPAQWLISSCILIPLYFIMEPVLLN